VHLLSWHPRIVAQEVRIDNPPWTPTGITAEIGQLTLIYDWPSPGRPWGIGRLEMVRAVLHLRRDEAGRANWQARDPQTGAGPGPPLIRSLSVPGARVQLDDRRRHLEFEGSVMAQEVPVRGRNPGLRISGAGRLNARQADFTLDGDSLAEVARERRDGPQRKTPAAGDSYFLTQPCIWSISGSEMRWCNIKRRRWRWDTSRCGTSPVRSNWIRGSSGLHRYRRLRTVAR